MPMSKTSTKKQSTRRRKNSIEKALEDNKKMLTMVINNVPQHIFWKDVNSVFIGCNDNFAKALGLQKPDDIVGKTDYDLVDKDKADHFVEVDKCVIEEDKPMYDMLECHKAANGETVWININKVPLHDEKGKVIGVLGTFQDVTDRVILNEKIKQSEEKYRSLIDFTNTSYIIMNMNLDILEANQNFVTMMGKESLDSVVGKNPRSWVFIKDVEKFDVYFRNLREGRHPCDVEVSFVTSDSTQVYVTMASNIIENGEQKIFCLLRDASYKKVALDKEFIAKQRRKDKLIQKIRQIRDDLRKVKDA